jgi:hypothetical protein
MNLNPQPNMKAEQADLRRHIVELERKVDKLVDTLAFVRGQPIIQAYVGKKLDLNENLNVVLLNQRIKDLEDVFVAHVIQNSLGDMTYTAL